MERRIHYTSIGRFTTHLLFSAMLLCTPLLLHAQNQITVSGQVTSEEGEPLIGASVLLKGTSTGTVTDIDGNYSLEAPDDGRLVFSYTGYRPVEEPIDGRSNLDVTLTTDFAQLQEVVVTGYGTQKRENLTGAVGTVSSEKLASRPITSASQSLQGQVSGVYVNQGSGEPGQDGASIRIRGIGTLNNADPLILVDGIEAPFDNIDPNDIESITVLKDAASAAIYGSRAANGVVLITTKRGQLNEKPTFNYTGFAGIQEANNIPDFIWGSQQFMNLRNEADINSGNAPLYPDDVVQEYGQIGPNTNWFNEILESAPIQQHSLSVSGGSEQTNFLLSFGYLDQESIANDGGEGTQRYNARLNLDTRVTDEFKIGASLYVSRQESDLDNVNQDGGFLARATRLGPNFPARDDLGRLADRDRRIDAIELSTPNILGEVRSLRRNLVDNRFLGSFYGDYEITPGLSVRGTFAVNYQTDDNDFLNNRVDMFDWRSGELGLVWQENRRVENQHSESLNLTSWLQLTYEKSFGLNNFKAIAGFNQESSESRQFGASRRELPSNSLLVLNTGNPETSTNYGAPTEWALRSFFGRVNYDFDNKYLFEFNVRRDGSSRFGSENRWATFPSFSAGWVLSEESFFQGLTFIDFFKIRGSWGQLGNNRIGNFPFASTISFGPSYNFGGAIVGGAAQVTLGNPGIRWETTTQTDVGINMSFFDGRLSVEADYFRRNTDDILFDQNNPGVTGVRTPTTRNIAEVENQGWEALVSYRQRYSNGFSFGISGNVTNVVSEVIKIDPEALADADRVIQGGYVIQRGSPINALFGLKATSIFQNQAEIDAAADQSLFGQPTPGDLQYEDINGDGVITIDDRTVLGQENPKWLYGINLEFGFKGFDVAAIFQGIGDVDTYEQGRFWNPFDNSGGVASFWVDRWTPDNPSTTIPKLRIPGGVNYNVNHSWFMTKRDYFRLKNLQVGYTLPSALWQNNFVQSFRVFANAQNVFTVTDFLGFDPERPDRNTNIAGFPQMRTITAGVNLRF